MQKRVEWLDVLKGIGIIYVTFAHLNPALPIEKHIYSFHMFLFFFISGYLYKTPENPKEFIKKRAKSLLIPFAVWDFVSTVAAIATGDEIKDSIIRMFMLDGQMCWNAPIWFLFTLFCVTVIFEFIDRELMKYQTVRICLPFAFLAIAYFCRHNYPLKIGILPIALFYYWLGYIANTSKYIYMLEKYRAIVIIIFTVINIVFSQLNARISVINCYYGNFVLCLVAGISGILMYADLAGYVKGTTKRLLVYLGKNSMFIMCTQYWFFRIFTMISMRVSGYDLWRSRSTLKAAIISCLTIILICLINHLIRTKIPRLGRFVGIRS